MASPTSRSLAECRRRGWLPDVTERWISFGRKKVRRDLFGFCDIHVVMPIGTPHGKGFGYIQTTDTGDSRKRARKILKLEWTLSADGKKRIVYPQLEILRAGGHILVWGWALRGPAGKRKLWTLKELHISYIGSADNRTLLVVDSGTNEVLETWEVGTHESRSIQ